MEFREKSGTSKRTFLMAAFALAMFFLGYFLLTPGQSALDTNGKVMDVLGDIRGRLDSLGM
ncbi:hypothetical protein M1146_03680 [Patescibacteria group bacterium]|nr:hypothetical protein [Patescibacteria group bacterium]